MIDEKHIKKDTELICPKCGKKFTIKVSEYQLNKGKYRKFCSRACANSRQFDTETNNKRSHTLKEFYKNLLISPERSRNYKTYHCKYCGKEFDMSEPRHYLSRTYCSKECCDKWVRENVYSKSGGYRKGSGRSKHGWYKGIYCDSTYELAYLIYCLDHNINIKRSKKVFEYFIDGKKHQYHPDFEVDGELIEIKGYHNELVDIKILSVDKPIKILYKKDLEVCFDYILNTYGKYKEHIKELYDDYKPTYKYICDECGSEFTRDSLIKTPHKFCSRSCSGKFIRKVNFKNKLG